MKEQKTLQRLVVMECDVLMNFGSCKQEQIFVRVGDTPCASARTHHNFCIEIHTSWLQFLAHADSGNLDVHEGEGDVELGFS